MLSMNRKPQLDLSRLQPTSKMSLKLTCLAACDNDVRAATELYNFIAGDMNLPDLNPIQPTTMGQIKEGADNVIGWISEHKDSLVQGYQIIQGLRTKIASTAIPSDIPPIPKV